jgi:ribonuclease D
MSIPILTSSAEIAAFARELAVEPVIAVDLEADSMHNYQEKVCLLQFTTPQTTLLIDPLAGGDLSPLGPVLADPAIRKIFHAADYDTRCLARDFKFEIRGLFDTMVACQFLGEEKVGLADVLGKYFGVALDKQFQRADWSIRPLPQGMIVYAAEDTRHLHQLCELLEGRLREKGRIEWVAEEFALLEQGRFREQEGPLWLRFKGANLLDRRQLATLDQLLLWRDGEARRKDRPPFKVIGNDILLALAKAMPLTAEAIKAIEGLPGWVAERFGRQVLPLIATAQEIPSEQLPSYPRGERRERDPEAEKRMLKLKAWRTVAASELALDPGILINNALLEELARAVPRRVEDLAGVAGMKRWQREVLGAGIVAALAGGRNG